MDVESPKGQVGDASPPHISCPPLVSPFANSSWLKEYASTEKSQLSIGNAEPFTPGEERGGGTGGGGGPDCQRSLFSKGLLSRTWSGGSLLTTSPPSLQFPPYAQLQFVHQDEIEVRMSSGLMDLPPVLVASGRLLSLRQPLISSASINRQRSQTLMSAGEQRRKKRGWLRVTPAWWLTLPPLGPYEEEIKGPNFGRLGAGATIISALSGLAMLGATIAGWIQWDKWRELWKAIWDRKIVRF